VSGEKVDKPSLTKATRGIVLKKTLQSCVFLLGNAQLFIITVVVGLA